MEPEEVVVQEEEVIPVPGEVENPEPSEEGGAPDTPAEEPAHGGEKPKKDRFSERIAEVVKGRNAETERANKNAEDAAKNAREAAYYRGLAEGKTSSAPAQADADPKPSADDFDDFEKFTEAITDWKVRQAIPEVLKSMDARTAQTVAQEKAQKAIAEAQVKFPDFDDAVAGVINAGHITPTMAMALRESDDFAELTYHLGKNPTEAARIAGLSPYAQVMAIGALPHKMKAAPVKKQTAAPEPFTTVKGGGGGDKPDVTKMNPNQYVMHKREQRKDNK